MTDRPGTLPQRGTAVPRRRNTRPSATGRHATVTQTGPSGTHHRIRSGDEPVHARSPLRLRLVLALTGLANGVAGVIVFALLDSPPLTWAFAALCVVALVNVAVVARHIRQGPHYQPGRTIPPYRPLEPDAPAPDAPRARRATPRPPPACAAAGTWS